ncbi:MAG: ABC transporter permease [Alphaproteobacteria bacterium]
MRGLRTGWRRRIRSVFRKEVRDHTRDVRSIILSLIFPLLGPVLIGLLLNATTGGGQLAEADAERAITVGLSGGEYAPDLVGYLEERKVELKPAPDDPEAQEKSVRRGRFAAILAIPPHAEGRERYGVKVIVNRNRPFSVLTAGLLSERVGDFGRIRAVRRVAEAGLEPEVIRPIQVAEENVGRDANVAGSFYNMMPPLILFMVFMGAVYLAIDVTVGERERGSLEPLLTAPMDRWELLGGKSLAALLFTAGILAVNLTAFKVILDLVTGSMQGAQPPPTLLNLIAGYVLIAPLMVFAVMLQMSIGAVTRSTKEAQIYLGLLPMIPMIPSLIMTFNPPENPAVLAAIPILGQAALLLKLVQNEPVMWSHALTSVAATGFAALLAFLFAARLFRREKLLY